jgi:hypothetical protein
MWSWQLVFLIHEEKITRFQIIFIHQFITLRNFSFKMSINFFLNCERYEVRVKSFFCFFIKKYMLHCRCCLWWGRNDVEFFFFKGGFFIFMEAAMKFFQFIVTLLVLFVMGREWRGGFFEKRWSFFQCSWKRHWSFFQCSWKRQWSFFEVRIFLFYLTFLNLKILKFRSFFLLN